MREETTCVLSEDGKCNGENNNKGPIIDNVEVHVKSDSKTRNDSSSIALVARIQATIGGRGDRLLSGSSSERSGSMATMGHSGRR